MLCLSIRKTLYNNRGTFWGEVLCSFRQIVVFNCYFFDIEPEICGRLTKFFSQGSRKNILRVHKKTLTTKNSNNIYLFLIIFGHWTVNCKLVANLFSAAFSKVPPKCPQDHFDEKRFFSSKLFSPSMTDIRVLFLAVRPKLSGRVVKTAYHVSRGWARWKKTSGNQNVRFDLFQTLNMERKTFESSDEAFRPGYQKKSFHMCKGRSSGELFLLTVKKNLLLLNFERALFWHFDTNFPRRLSKLHSECQTEPFDEFLFKIKIC